MKPLLTVLLPLLLTLAQTHKSFNCNFHEYEHSNHYRTRAPKFPLFHKQKNHKQSSHDHEHKSESHRRLLYGAGRPAMRITLNTDDLDTVKAPASTQPQTTTARLNFLKKAMFVTQTFFQSRLKVSSEGTLSIPALCYDYPTPDTTIGASDLHIYVIYITDRTQGFGATGVSCEWNPTSPSIVDPTLKAGRPTVGRIKFNTFNIVDNEGSLTNRLFASITATCLHETIHILGFDPSLYSTYLDSNTGLPYTQVVTSRVLHGSRTGGANYMMITPAVSAWALSHYGCNTIVGMPLENQDGNAVGAHWQRLAIYDQLMTGTKLGPQKPFTALTFALLKDMGWYGVDDKFNDTTNYGYQKGCSFLTDACYATTPNSKYFCNPASYVNVTQCSSTFTGKSTCSSETALMADGCGMFKQYFHCVDPSSVGDFYQSHTLQAFGTSNLCFKGLIAMSGIETTYRSRCYPMVCDYQTTTITITIGPYTVYCLSNEQGTNKTVTGMQNSIECPIFNDFCTLGRKICPNWCSGNGFCTRGICNCYSTNTIMYSGADCSITTCTGSNYYHAATSSCVPSCPSGYYANIQSKSCLACASSCNQCRDQSTICTSCISTPSNPQYYYVSQNICVGQCPSITFLQVDSCILCDATTAGCLTCSGSSTNCLSCVNSAHYLNQFGNCGPTCSISPYSLYDDVSKVCRQSCPNTLYLSSGHCVSCNPNFRIVDDTVNRCVTNCLALPGYYQDNTNYVCGKCNQTCKQCVGSYAQNCTTCWSNRTQKYQHLKMCIGTCPDGFYADDTVLKCQKCIVSLYCATCQVVSTVVKCKTCKYGYFLQANRTCMLNCDPTFYKNRWNNSCDACHYDCRDCIGPYQSQCLNCVSPKYFLRNSTGGYCLTACPTSGYVTFLSTTCLACHQTCLTCINQSSSGCATCVSGLYLESNRCRFVCSPAKYPENSTWQCLPCDVKCKYCFNNTADNCTQCQTGYVLNNFTCTTSCPTGQAANAYNVCQKKAAFQQLAIGFLMLIALLMTIIL